MGPANSKQQDNIQFSLNHPKFSNGKFVYEGNERQMQITMGIDNKEYDKWKVKSKTQLPSEFLLLPLNHNFNSKGLCGSTGTLSINFNDFPYLLTQQIMNRKGKKKLFQEQQIWYLLFGLISAKSSMNPPFSKVGDIRPHNIFLNQKGKMKISNINSWPHQPTNFVKSFDNQPTYLAPQQMNSIKMGGTQSQKNNQSQMYSIGLTLLSAVTLEDFSSCYDLKKQFFNPNLINEKLNQFKISRSYSDILKGVICNLCQIDPARRVNSQQLWKWISPFQQKIRDSQNFFIPSAPDKIHQQVGLVRQAILQQTSKNLLNETKIDPAKLDNNRPVSSAQRASFLLSNKNVTSSPLTSGGIGGTNFVPGFSSIPTWNAQSVYIPVQKGFSFNDNLSPITNKTNNPITAPGSSSNFRMTQNASPIEAPKGEKAQTSGKKQ